MKRLRLLTLAFGFCLAVGLPLAAMAGPVPGGTDTDLDGVEDAFDNCTARKNPTQVDTDHDGCGQFCDFDWNNDGLVSNAEFNKAAKQGGSALCGSPACPGPPFNCCVCDFNQDGACTNAEINQIAKAVGTKPGVSGITNAVCKTGRCQCTPAP
jgi:hypothetical protein